MILDTLKLTFQPASFTAVLTLFTIGVGLLYAKPRWGRVWLVSALLIYWLIGSPIGADLLARSLATGDAPIARPEDARGARAVVMLGGGSVNVRAGGHGLTYVNRPSGLRALETARVYHLLGDPLVIVSGGVTDKTPGAMPESDAYRVAMVSLGVPESRIVMESESHNTHDEAIILERMLRDRGIDRFVLVTSPLHMARSLAAFAARGLHPVPSPAPLYADRAGNPFFLLPNEAALEVGNGVVYEWCARTYYWARGWTRPQ